MANNLFNFNGWIKVRDKTLPHASEFAGGYRQIDELEIHSRLDNDFTFQISVDKALTSMSDTATIKIVNHPILEELYTNNLSLLRHWAELDLEVSIMLYYRYPHADQFPDKCNCIFTGDIVDISVDESNMTVDQSLTIRAASGHRASLYATTTKAFRRGTPYRDIMYSLFNDLQPYGYELVVVRDPDAKLSKVFKKSRTVHGKVIDELNTIAKDLDMVFGFDCNPWTYLEMSRDDLYDDPPTNLSAIDNNKRCYFVDKRAVFDTTGIHSGTGTEPPVSGVNGLRVSGDTSHEGLIGYTKSQFTFNTATEPVFNIGMPVYADDVRAHLVIEDERVIGRINRMTISNFNTRCECSYVDRETGLAILEREGKNSGAYIL